MQSAVLLSICFFLFFFSSRRRHTRFKCDWSSDVCSSDLISFKDSPFGGLNVKLIDTTDPPKVMAWARTLSDDQKRDLSNRCSVINSNASNQIGRASCRERV